MQKAYHLLLAPNSKEALKEQALAMLMLDLKRAEERAETEGWIDAIYRCYKRSYRLQLFGIDTTSRETIDYWNE